MSCRINLRGFLEFTASPNHFRALCEQHQVYVAKEAQCLHGRRAHPDLYILEVQKKDIPKRPNVRRAPSQLRAKCSPGKWFHPVQGIKVVENMSKQLLHDHAEQDPEREHAPFALHHHA